MCRPGSSHFLDTLLCESFLAPLRWVPTATLSSCPGRLSVGQRRSVKPMTCTFLTRLASPTREDLSGGVRGRRCSLLILLLTSPHERDFEKPHCFTPTYSSIRFLGTGKGTFLLWCVKLAIVSIFRDGRTVRLLWSPESTLRADFSRHEVMQSKYAGEWTILTGKHTLWSLTHDKRQRLW